MMTVKSISGISAIALLLIGGAISKTDAQIPAATPTPSCPSVYVSVPESVSAGQSFTVTANLSGGDPKVNPTYNWTVSDSMIEEGQGTATITISTKGMKKDSSITATIDVGGYYGTCYVAGSGTAMITAGAEARKSDEFGNIRIADLPPRLDNFKLELQNETAATGYVIVYGGRTSAPDAAQKIAAAAKTYLAKGGKIEARRIVTINGGYREEVTMELWLAPEGATPPQASPTLDPSEIKPAKKTPAKALKGKKS